MNKRERRLNEFCAVGKLEDYRAIMQVIFTKIDNAGCSISVRDDGGPSMHDFANDRGNCHIRVPLKTFTKNPIEAIWVILHEFGHHLSGSIDKSSLTKEVRIKREEEAWDLARKELLEFPLLAKDILDFDVYARNCLESYYKND